VSTITKHNCDCRSISVSGRTPTVVEKGITKGATKAATLATKGGWYKLAGLFLKVAAAAPLAAKILVGVAVVAVAVTIYHVVRAA
jgi:hypothetical protein